MDNLITSTHKQWQEAKKYAAKACRATSPDMARQLDNCTIFTGDETLSELAALIFTPQGWEFMLANRFPSLNLFRKYKRFQPEQYGVYIDAGEISLKEPGKAFLIGNTKATIHCTETRLTDIILMHGAEATVIARGYAVIHIEHDRKSTATVNATSTVKVL